MPLDKISLKLKAKKIGLVLLTFFGIYLVGILNYPHQYWKNYFKQDPLSLGFDVLSTIVLSLLIIELYQWIDRVMNRFLPWHEHTVKRWALQTIVQLISIVLLLISYGIITYVIMQSLDIQFEGFSSENKDVAQVFLSIIFLTLIVSMINTVAFLSSNWRKEIFAAAEYKTKAAESKQLAAQTELRALRLQLDSHFVFNNLSVLSELILKDQQLGFEYSENFSKVYRYLLLNAKKELITLKEEIKFLGSYLFLLKNRMGNGVEFDVQISESQLDLNLPPITLQLLVENAIKHNRIDKDDPLLIKIYTDQNDQLVVENIIKPLHKPPLSSGVGLENIAKRYLLLSDRKPIIEHGSRLFVVKIPLLK